MSLPALHDWHLNGDGNQTCCWCGLPRWVTVDMIDTSVDQSVHGPFAQLFAVQDLSCLVDH